MKIKLDDTYAFEIEDGNIIDEVEEDIQFIPAWAWEDEESNV